MIKQIKLLLLLFLFFSSFLPCLSKELCRIKIYNQKDGDIKVSFNQGKEWEKIGQVLKPISALNPKGFNASRWGEDSSVVAVGVNAIHIRVGENKENNRINIFTLLPREVEKGAFTSNSSLITSFKAGGGIFGQSLITPFVGSKVYLLNGEELNYIPSNFKVSGGEIFLIVVDLPEDMPSSILFENWCGGEVIATYPGGEKKTLAIVFKPVGGTGRFEGTLYTPPSRIRANHPGVIDISTSSLGEVGGFQIVPSVHARDAEMLASQFIPQYMVIGPLPNEGPLEGTSPLFKGYIHPAWHPGDLTSLTKLALRELVKVKFDTGNWTTFTLFPINGKQDHALFHLNYIEIILPRDYEKFKKDIYNSK